MEPIKRFIQIIFKHDNYSLKFNTIRSAIWSSAGKGSANVIRILGNLILTRILFPEAFGLMAIANVVIMMIAFFADTGVSVSIIQNPRGADKEFIDTSWIISIIRGSLLLLVISILAWPAAIFYSEPQLKWLLLIMGFNPFISGFQNPALPLLVKNFRVEKQAAMEISTQVVGLVVTILLSWVMESVYALAIGSISSSILKLFASYVVVPFRPSFKWDRAAGQELLNFGKFIFLNTIVTIFINQLDVLMIGKMLGTENVSFYNIGKNLGGLMATFCVQMVAQSYMPAVSSIQTELDRVQDIYSKTVAFLIAVIVPISMILSLFAQDIIKMLYDARYHLSYISMYWIGLSGIFRTIAAVTGVTFFALGKPVYETLSKLFGMILLVVFLPYSIRTYGLAGGSFCISIVYVVIPILECAFLKVKFSFKYKTIVGAWIQAIVLSAICYAFYHFLRPFLQNERFHNIPFAIICSVLFMIASAFTYWKIQGSNLLDFKTILIGKSKKQPL